jgi:membrane protein
MQQPAKPAEWWPLLSEAISRLFADEAIPLAGNIAFRTIFSVFPFLIFLVALAGFFGNDMLAEQVVGYFLAVAPPELVRPLSPEIRSILTVPRTGLLSLSALITIWSAMGGVDSVRVGLNRAYDLKEHRSVLRLYVQSVLFVIAAAAVTLAMALLIVLAPVSFALIDAYAPDIRPSFRLIEVARFPVVILLLTGWLLICHRILPAQRLKIRDVLPGVVITVAVWIALATVYSYYLARFNNFASTYASLSGVFAAMFFLYLAALVLILGGELNRVLIVRRSFLPSAEPPNLGQK